MLTETRAASKAGARLRSATSSGSYRARSSQKRSDGGVRRRSLNTESTIQLQRWWLDSIVHQRFYPPDRSARVWLRGAPSSGCVLPPPTSRRFASPPVPVPPSWPRSRPTGARQRCPPPIAAFVTSRSTPIPLSIGYLVDGFGLVVHTLGKRMDFLVPPHREPAAGLEPTICPRSRVRECGKKRDTQNTSI